jgi:Tfp pilus assembly protein PilW
MKRGSGFILLEILIGLTISLLITEATTNLLRSLTKSSVHFTLPSQHENPEDSISRCTVISSEETTLLCNQGDLQWYLFL